MNFLHTIVLLLVPFLLQTAGCLFLATGAAAAALAADEGPLSASRTVIIVTGKAEVFHGNESLTTVPPGSVLRYSKENGPWLLIPRHKGWLNREHVVPIELAVEHFDQIIKGQPTPQAFHHRGIAHLQLGKHAAAIKDFDRATAEGLKDPGVFINRGVAKERAGDLKGAVAEYSRAIQVDPANARAHDNRSSALAALGQLEASLADSHRAIELAPDFAEAWNNAGVTRRMQGDFDQAIENYSQAIKLFPGYPAAFANRGYARKQLGQFQAAIDDYQEAIRLDPDASQPCNDLAWLLATCRDDSFRDAKRALTNAQRACELTRFRDADCLDTLAAAYAAGGDFARAGAFAQQALELAKNDARRPIESRLALFRAGTPYVEQ